MKKLILQIVCCLFSAHLMAQAYGNLKPQSDQDGKIIYAGEHSRGRGSSGGYNFKIPSAELAKPVLEARCKFNIGNQTPGGHGQVSSQSWFQFINQNGKENVGFTLQTKRYNNKRAILFETASEKYEVPVNFPTGTELEAVLFLDRAKKRFCFVVSRDGSRIFSSGWQTASGLVPAAFRLIVRSNTNDGLLNSFYDIRVNGLTEAELEKLLPELDKTGIAACSTLPRRYKSINPKMYNSSFVQLTDSNNCDRVGLYNAEEAEKRARMLSDLGFTGALYNGRHFRMNYVEEFPLIRDGAKVLIDACRKYGISVIEHHEPTIMEYRGYPMMLNNLGWSQSDIRTGENSFWFCPVNPGFQQAFLDYLGRYHETAGASGYMIDEIARGNRDACYCESCREGFRRSSGEEPPQWTDHNQPSGRQKNYMEYSNEQISKFKRRVLAMLQGITPETFIMTYCSDYADPNAMMEDLTLHAAEFSSFIGWENMIYDPLNSWTSFMRCLKMRNSYGDFYNIPIWSLNREQVVREAHYLAWAMCQGGRHSIWYGSRLPLDTAEDREYFARYNKWGDVMPHQYARTLTNTGVLLSAQAKKATADRRFYWEDLCGVMDTLIRGNRQFDTLLDGDLFYSGRLGKYKALLLVSQATLSDRQCENLAGWVKDGGVAVVTRNTSLYDEAHNRRHELKLGKFLNVRYSDKVVAGPTVKSMCDALKGGFALPSMLKVALIRPGESKILAAGVTANGEELPLVVETPYGKGRFIYVAAALGDTVYEMEMRNGRSYNYSPNPPLQAFIGDLADYASGSRIVAFKAPENVIALVNQIQNGSPDIYADLYNFTGQKIKRGEKGSYGVPEKLSFPGVAGDMVLKINRPCGDTAILSTPEREGRSVIKGERDGNVTVFRIPGSLLGAFAQVKIGGEKYGDQAIVEPPVKVLEDIPAFVRTPEEISIDDYYYPAKLEGKLSEPGGDAVLVRIDGKPVIVSDCIQTAMTETGAPLRCDDLAPAISNRVGFRGEGVSGELAGGKVLSGDFPFVREIARRGDKDVEITLAGTLMPKNYDFKYFGYAIRIPVDVLKGAVGEYSSGMHRSLRAPRKIKLTGQEPEGKTLAMAVRQIQFTGGPVDFMLDFAVDGIWGMFIEGLGSQYKAHLRREGEFYVFYVVQNSGISFGAKNSTKVIVRPGRHDYKKYHPFNYIHYQLNRPASVRMQFTDEAPASGFKVRDVPGYELDFEAVNPGDWSNKERVKLIRVNTSSDNPLFSAGVRGSGPNTLTIPHENGVVLVNLCLKGLGGPIKGEVNTGGKNYRFDLADGARDTLVIPSWVKDGCIRVKFDGNWAISGIVVQPLMSGAEDFLFSRSWWNCGISPYLIPELKQDPADWRFWRDQPYRRARWNW